GRQVVVDDENFGSQGKVLRQRRTPSEKSSRIYSGSDAYQLFLEAYQLILWKQTHALGIVKGLWALRLQMLTLREDNYLSDDTTSHGTFSSQSGTDTSNAVEDEESVYHKKKLTKSPKLIDSLALCYLGMLLLRMPVSVGFLMKWMIRDEVPLLRAIRLVPQVMRDRLPATYLGALDTRTIPSGDTLHRAISNLALLYSREFNITFPKLNTSPIQLSYMRSLYLPLEIYPAMTSLQKLVQFKLAYLDQHDGKAGGKVFHRIQLPELQLMALLVVTVKLFYPFQEDVASAGKRTGNGGECLRVRAYDEPASLVFDWGKWLAVHKEDEEKRASDATKLENDEALCTRETDAFELSEEQMDDYMDWYERMFILTNDTSTNPLAEMFPTSRPQATPKSAPTTTPKTPDEQTVSRIQTVMSHLTSRPLTTDNAFNSSEVNVKPGSRYRRYRKEDDFPDEITRYFHEKAAEVIGVSVKTLLMGVYSTETRVLDWLAERKRAARQQQQPQEQQGQEEVQA
ncbi:Pol I core factor CF, partial [Ascosphaera pollenicola]